MGFLADTQQKIRTRFNTEVVPNLPVDTTVHYDNQKEVDTPAKPDLRVRFTILPGQSFQGEFGWPSTYRHPGVAIAQVFGRLHVGIDAILELADIIYLAFNNRLDDNIHYQTVYVTNVGNVEGFGDWWQVNVTCPFFADDRRPI